MEPKTARVCVCSDRTTQGWMEDFFCNDYSQMMKPKTYIYKWMKRNERMLWHLVTPCRCVWMSVQCTMRRTAQRSVQIHAIQSEKMNKKKKSQLHQRRHDPLEPQKGKIKINKIRFICNSLAAVAVCLFCPISAAHTHTHTLEAAQEEGKKNYIQWT